MRGLVAKILLLLSFALTVPASFAQGLAPDALLRAVSIEVIDKIKQDQESLPGGPVKVAALVETKILPLFDFAHMTRLAVGRNWPLATPDQQRALIEEFKTLLVRTYSNALTQYSNEVIVFQPPRTVPPDAGVSVRSVVKQPGKEPMTLDYQLAKTQAGWKIYDVKVAGVCLVSTYRDVFAEKVRDGSVDGLIKFLEEENRGAGSRFRSVKASFWETSRVMYAIFQNLVLSGRQ